MSRCAVPAAACRWWGAVTRTAAGTISGKHKTDAIDADMLAMAWDVFDLHPLDPPTPTQLALRRAVVRRGKLVIDGKPGPSPVDLVGAVGVPDVWTAFAGSWPTAVGQADPLARSAGIGLSAAFERDRGRRGPNTAAYPASPSVPARSARPLPRG